MNENELYHHGTKGQKCGVRKYQNPDGSLTEAEKKHYGRGIAGAKKRKLENKMLRNKVESIKVRKKADDKYSAWKQGNSKYDKMDKEWSKLDDKAEKLSNKAAYSGKNSSKMWEEAGKAQKKADDLWEKVSKQQSDNDNIWKEYAELDDSANSLTKKYNDMATKYMDKYGSVEFNKLPKTDTQITQQFIDDTLDVMGGVASKKNINKKYKGTGFRIS